MKYVSEYRDGAVVQAYVAEIAVLVTPLWTLMEICGDQTHTVVKSLIADLTYLFQPGLAIAPQAANVCLSLR